MSHYIACCVLYFKSNLYTVPDYFVTVFLKYTYLLPVCTDVTAKLFRFMLHILEGPVGWIFQVHNRCSRWTELQLNCFDDVFLDDILLPVMREAH